MRILSESPFDFGTAIPSQLCTIVRREYQCRTIPYCEVSYAYPRVGDEGLLTVVWCDGTTMTKLSAHTARWTMPPGRMPYVAEMRDIPLEVASFIGSLVAKVHEAESMPDLEQE